MPIVEPWLCDLELVGSVRVSVAALVEVGVGTGRREEVDAGVACCAGGDLSKRFKRLKLSN